MTKLRGFGQLSLRAASAWLASGLSTAVLAQSSLPAPETTQVSNGDMADTVNDPRIEAARKSGMGTWKWAVPPVKMKGGFEDHDPIGLAAGKLVPADCSINWTDPDTHKLYCFTSATSLVYFLDAPHTNLARAEKGWRALKGPSS
ncbi:MAG TPA: hypothetical protein VGB93_06230 [Methylovirgula sp.]